MIVTNLQLCCHDGLFGFGMEFVAIECAYISQNGRLNQRHFIDRGTQFANAVNVPFGVTYEKIGTIQRRLAWPLHKDDTLLQSGRSSDRNIYFIFIVCSPISLLSMQGEGV